MLEKFGYDNIMQVPRLEKVVLNMGVAKRSGSLKVQAAVADLTLIAGQKPVVTRAKKSIAGFKLREGMPIGAKVPCGETGCLNSLIVDQHRAPPGA